MEVDGFTGTRADLALIDRLAWDIRWSNRARSTALAESALRMTRDSGRRADLESRAAACRVLAWQAKWRGDFDAVDQFCSQGACLSHHADRPDILADVLSVRAVVTYSRGDLARSAQLLGEAEAGVDLKDRRDTQVDLISTRANIFRYAGEQDDAHAAAMQALSLADGPDQARMHHNIARLCLGQGDVSCAIGHAIQGLHAAHKYDNRVILPYVYEVLGFGYAALEKPETAWKYLQDGARIAREDDDQRAEAQLWLAIGNLLLDSGAYKAAISALWSGLRIAKSMRYQLWEQQFTAKLRGAYHEIHAS